MRNFNFKKLSLSLIGLLGLSLTLGLGTAQAQGSGGSSGADDAKAGAAVAGVVVEVIGGLSGWVNDQSDDCAAAALAAAWGNDCTLEQEECSETGWANAFCTETADNSCAYSSAYGRAYESVVGSWGGCEVEPWAATFTRALHGCKDKHYGKAWGKASVDGSAKASTRSTPGAKPGQNHAGPTNPQWPDGTVLAAISVDMVSVEIPKLNKSDNSWSFFVEIDGTEIFRADASVNGRGVPTVTGDIPASEFAVTYDASRKVYTLSLSGFETRIPIMQLAMPAPGLSDSGPDAANTEAEISVHAESEVEVNDDADQESVCVGDIIDIETQDRIDGFDSFGNYNETGEGTLEEGYRHMAREIANGNTSQTLLLGSSFPNPARINAAIPFAVGTSQEVSLKVYDVAGRLTRTLAQGYHAAGQHQVSWNATNNNGQRVSPGIYYYVLQSGKERTSKKLVVTP
ncbi:MAG: T9SS type A sorting domain-containing protein [Candidatus Eisenbacteria bacterium]|uniref:T9SS type A sorting domain-containing protein n=1 Tax=Eiseniibacteriota bacterium TaxID=2212470 RepID=A0A7Y2H213_UNCEI|nr:T9SS type A sorting domain-containing protein [Candidatus Eisenbacteria bacterium]